MKEEILRIASDVLSEDEVNEIIKDKFKKAISDACDSAFRWGDVKSAIEKKIKEVMVPYIDSRDFSEFIPKLDTVLTEIINSDNCMADKNILKNFKDLIIAPEQKEIKVTDLFRLWIEWCQKSINTDNLEIDYDDGVSYQNVDCEMRVEEQDKPSWSDLQRAVIIFENEHDEKLNVEIPISKWLKSIINDGEYTVDASGDIMISSLRRLNDFQVLLLRLKRAGTKIIIDNEYDNSYIQPEAEPEVSFS